jgi:hypothetical protein
MLPIKIQKEIEKYVETLNVRQFPSSTGKWIFNDIYMHVQETFSDKYPKYDDEIARHLDDSFGIDITCSVID